MKPTIEQICAWIDGEMSEAERLAFERDSGDALQALEQEKRSVGKLGELLRAAPAPNLKNQDFFSSQIASAIEGESPASETASSRTGRRFSEWFFPIALSSAAAVALLVVSNFESEPKREHQNTQVLATVVDNKNVSVVAFQMPDSELTVIWMDGLDYLPDSHSVN